MKVKKTKESSIKPLEITSRYGDFNKYIASRFRDLIRLKQTKKTDPCVCASCERYCNTLHTKGKCNPDKKC